MCRPVFIWIGFFCLLGGCSFLEPAAIPDEQSLDGPLPGLSEQEIIRHQAGDAIFNDQVFTAETGLGPLFVSSSCGSCHAGDGKGHPFTALVRYGQSDTVSNSYLEHGGPQWQNRAIAGFEPEAFPSNIPHSTILAPQVSGVGFFDAVPDSLLYSFADPFDLNQDGISGRLNWINVPAYVTPRRSGIVRVGKRIGRFGKKGAAYDLVQQTAQAFNQDMGICSEYEAYDTHTGKLSDPEISLAGLEDVVFYLATLKAPPIRNAADADVIKGRRNFLAIGCGSCHVPSLSTGFSPIAALSKKSFEPYTDLLLHDMGPELDDGYTEGSAKTSEWKTAPLWGLGLSARSQGGGMHLMHDGRAKSLEQAISLHGGEGAASRARFEALSPVEKAQLLKFLMSL